VHGKRISFRRLLKFLQNPADKLNEILSFGGGMVSVFILLDQTVLAARQAFCNADRP
jgi:hypothetical protein